MKIFWWLEATKLSIHIADKKIVEGSKTKSIFENIILSQRDLFAGETYT